MDYRPCSWNQVVSKNKFTKPAKEENGKEKKSISLCCCWDYYIHNLAKRKTTGQLSWVLLFLSHDLWTSIGRRTILVVCIGLDKGQSQCKLKPMWEQQTIKPGSHRPVHSPQLLLFFFLFNSFYLFLLLLHGINRLACVTETRLCLGGDGGKERKPGNLGYGHERCRFFLWLLLLLFNLCHKTARKFR